MKTHLHLAGEIVRFCSCVVLLVKRIEFEVRLCYYTVVGYGTNANP